MEYVGPALIKKIRQQITESDKVVFLAEDFAGVGSLEMVRLALQVLTEGGCVAPIGECLFARVRQNRIIGNAMLDSEGGFDAVAKEALTKLGYAWEVGSAESSYMSGGPQVPAKTVVKIPKADPLPIIGYGQYQLRVERSG